MVDGAVTSSWNEALHYAALAKEQDQMAELSAEELRESLYATCIGITRLTELLIARDLVPLDSLAQLLTTAEAMAPDQCSRRGAAIVRNLMEGVLRRGVRKSREAPPYLPSVAADRELARGIGHNSGNAARVKGSDFDDAMLAVLERDPT